MDLLNKPINSFGFADIVAFCKEGHPEGIQLDYKKEFPKEGLAKHFAAFSNTRGGVVIIGVGENKKTATPKTWSGLKNDGKLAERVSQYAANVDPTPRYDVHVTDEVRGKVFVLVRIFEGDRTPYYVQNDANLWVRTGNVSKLIDIASPDHVELLFGKKDKARKAREINIKRFNEVYGYALRRAEKERLRLVAEEKAEFKRKRDSGDAQTEVFQSSYYQAELGPQASISEVLLQPFYPRGALIRPDEIKDSLAQLQVAGRWLGAFPPLDMERIPNGLLGFDWRKKSGLIECGQIYSNGLVGSSLDVLQIDENGNRQIWLSHIASRLYIVLKVAGNFYRLAGYQGGVVGHLLLDDVEGVRVHTLKPDGRRMPHDELNECLLPTYRWDLELDTSLLNDEKELQALFIEKVKEVYWHLGYGADRDILYKDYLKQQGWLVE